MNFSIRRITENGLSLFRLTDHQNGSYADILPSHGALLHAFTVTAHGQPLNIIDGYADAASLDRQLATSYKSSKLSPFVCRIPEGKWEWQGEQLEFEKKFMDGSAIHGLLYNKAFRVVDQFTDDHQASLRLKYHYRKDDRGYPFEYICEVVYSLHPSNVLQVETKVFNADECPIPVADGWHPYFTLGAAIDDCELTIASDSMLEFNDKLIPTGKMIYDPSLRNGGLLGNRFLDNCFQLEQTDGEPVCIFSNPARGIQLHFFASRNYPFLQIYTPDHRRSIAIENLSGAPDCFNNGIGVTVLNPRQTETFTLWYKVEVE